MNTENRPTDVRGKEVGGWVRRVKGLGREIKRPMNTDNSMVIARRKGMGR